MIGGCSSVPPAQLGQCQESATARFNSIPIASGQEHAQALRFAPSSADHCVVYLVRGRDFWTGASVRRVAVVLAPQSLHTPRLPADPAQLPSVFGDRVVEIDDRVYAMWEAPAGNHFLLALSVSGYGAAFIAQAKGTAESDFAARRELNCAAGEALFFSVEDRGYQHRLEVREREAGEGKQLMRGGLRSAGVHDRDGPGFRDCGSGSP